VTEPNEEFDALVDTMKRAGAALRDAGIPHALGGGLACWARGGPQTEHDVDFLVKPADAKRAQLAHRFENDARHVYLVQRQRHCQAAYPAARDHHWELCHLSYPSERQGF
jgi:hypothetical protein